MASRSTTCWKTACLAGLPFLLLAACLTFRPFSTELASERFSMRMLSAVQRGNLRLTARRLDGLALKPGETFSFNQTVGPRTTAQGYRAAPSYLGDESPLTPGGGICLLSSALYQLALKTGMRIEARTAHLRIIRSVPPGLDATVWDGNDGADLRFQNTSGRPVRLRVDLVHDVLSVALEGTGKLPLHPISRIQEPLSAGKIRITVFRDDQMISREVYLPSHTPSNRTPGE